MGDPNQGRRRVDRGGTKIRGMKHDFIILAMLPACSR